MAHSPRVKYIPSDHLTEALRVLANSIGLNYIKPENIYGVVSIGSTSRAYARIWGTPPILVAVDKCQPIYVIELIYPRIQGKKCNDILRVLVHELLHIPRTFSGSLRTHGEWSKAKNITKYCEKLGRETKEEICRLISYSIDEVKKYSSKYALH